MAKSASGQASAHDPIGAMTNGADASPPTTSVRRSGSDTSTRTRGTSRRRSKAARFALRVSSSSEPPSMNSKTERGRRRRARVRRSSIDRAAAARLVAEIISESRFPLYPRTGRPLRQLAFCRRYRVGCHDRGWSTSLGRKLWAAARKACLARRISRSNVRHAGDLLKGRINPGTLDHIRLTNNLARSTRRAAHSDVSGQVVNKVYFLPEILAASTAPGLVSEEESQCLMVSVSL